MRDDYVHWLAAQGYNDNTINTQTSHVRQIEKFYGGLEDLISGGGLSTIVDEFTYTLDDERSERANPTKVDFNGRTYTRLQSLKGAIKRYARFLDEDFAPETGDIIENEEPAAMDKQKFALERDMQVALRRDISGLGNGLTIIDDGVERSVESGFIDILCRDSSGQAIVVELKSGKTDARVVGQILGYMGDLIAEDEFEKVRGIIVAHDFDKRTRSAALAIPNLTLMTYNISFAFERLR